MRWAFLKNYFILNAFSLLSKVTGLARDIAIGRNMHETPLTAAYLFSITVCSSLRRMLSEGAFDSALVTLIPRCKNYKVFIAHCIVGVIVFSVITYFFVFVISGMVVDIIAPKIQDRCNAILFLRVSMAYFLFAPLAYLLVGILQARKEFAIYSVMPIALNLVIITIVSTVDNIHIVSYSFAIGGIVQLLIAVAFTYKYIGSIDWGSMLNDILKYMKIVLPMMAYGILLFGNMGIFMFFVTMYNLEYVYYFIERFKVMPVAIIGNAIGIVVLPSISELYSNLHKGDCSANEKIQKSFNLIIELGMIMSVPAVIGIYSVSDLIGSQVIRFNTQTTINFAYYFPVIAIGIPSLVLSRICQSFMYASIKMKDYFIISVGALMANFLATIALNYLLGFMGVIIAGITVQLCVLIAMASALSLTIKFQVVKSTIHSLILSGIMLASIMLIRAIMPDSIFTLILCIIVGIAVYGVLVYKQLFGLISAIGRL